MKRSARLALLATALLGSAPLLAATDEKAQRDGYTRLHQENGILPVPIHRGGGMLMPENTLPAFHYGWSLNLVPESDIRTTADGVIVTIHDRTVARTAPGAPDALRNVPIEQLTLAQLQSVDVGAYRGYPEQRTPTLDAVFAAMAKDPGKMMYLDYKDADLDVLAELVRKHGVQRQAIFTTNRYDLIQGWRERLPQSPAMIWMGGTQEQINATLDSLRKVDFAGIYVVHMHYRPLPGSDDYNMSDAFMLQVQEELAARGIIAQFQAMVVETPAVYEHLYGIGIQHVGTDYPDAMLQVRSRYFN